MTTTSSARSRPSLIRPTAGRVGLCVVGAVMAAVVLSSCAAGQQAATAHEVSVVDGAMANVSTMALRNIGVAGPDAGPSYAKGTTADLLLDLVNNGAATDALVSVSTPAAASVVITAPTAATTASAPAGTPAPSGSAVPAGAAIEIPATKLVRITSDTGSGVVALTGLVNPLVSGQSIPVTFTFRTAGSITVTVPVKLRPGQTGGATIPVAPSGDS